jgi:hypothetical protein
MGSLRIKAFSKWVPGKQMKGKESLRKIILLFLTRKMSGHKLPITPTSIRPRPTKSTNNVEKYDSGGSTPTSMSRDSGGSGPTSMSRPRI